MSVPEGLKKKFKSKKVCDILSNMYCNEATADVFFTLKSSNGQQVRIPAHKLILAQGSTVFHQMFYGELRETGDVHITDVFADKFKEFLQFFYLNEIVLTNEHVGEVLYLTNKYDLPECSVICGDFLEEILDSKTMCWGYELALLYDVKKLCSFCEKAIAFDIKSIFQSESFKCCNELILKQILLMNNLNCDEIDVFKAYMKWAESSAEQHNSINGISTNTLKIGELTMGEKSKLKLGECFNLIRFPTMTGDQFSACLEIRDDILNTDEITDIKQHIAMGNPLMAAKRFDDTVRLWTFQKRTFSEFLWCERFDCDTEPQPDDGDYYDLSKNGSLTISSNKRIILTSIKTHRIESYKCRYVCDLSVKFEIWTKTDDSLPEPDQLVFTHLDTIRTGRENYIRFDNPVLYPRQFYEIRTKTDDHQQPIHLHATIFGHFPKVFLGHGIEIQFKDHGDENNATNSLITELCFVPW